MPQHLFTQEIGVGCNLSQEHTRCPAHTPERYRGNLDASTLMSEDTLVANALLAWDRGFRGHYAWHLYSEPTLHFDRIERVQGRIISERPSARFCLWTNGTLIGPKITVERCSIFDRIVVSNYGGEDSRAIYRKFATLKRTIRVQGGTLDLRMQPSDGPSSGPCFRYGRELEIDAYGNWRLCCGDWEGTAVKMNVHTHGICAILDSYEALQPLICADPQSPDVPALCHTCRTRGRR